MNTGRMEAFTDGVIAVAITIMVLDMKVPAGTDLQALTNSAPVLLAYVLSYINVGIFWNNHHHMLHATEHVDGKVLWANLFLLFWITLIPFVLRWIDDSAIAPLPAAAYGVVLSMATVGYLWLERAIIACNGPDSKLASAGGSDRKAMISLALYAAGVALAFVSPWIAALIYVANAMIWLIPDRRIETRLKA
jgi:uncharacterized membrane protein